MVVKVRMPKIDANVEEGTIGGWLCNTGDKVKPGQSLVEIITDKVTFELQCEQEGILRAQVAPEKSVVPVGYVIALLSDDANEPLPDVSGENRQIVRQHLDKMLAPDRDEAAGQRQTSENRAAARVRATPAARRLARRENVRLEDIEASDGGAVQESDVIRYLRDRKGAEGDGGHGD
jgi:pyruvate dehydrogenase E2 component (dihydrolipoamide acetyltransferase)